MGIFLIPVVMWVLLQTAVSTAAECDYKLKFPDLNGTALSAEENSNISLELSFPPECNISPEVKVARKINDGTRHVDCIIQLQTGTCFTVTGPCSCLAQDGVYQLTKRVGLSDNTTWVVWLNDYTESETEVIVNILPYESGSKSDVSITAREPEIQTGNISTAPGRVSEDSTPLPTGDLDRSTTRQSASTLQADAGESSTNSTTIGLAVAFALVALIGVAIFVCDKFWKGKGDQIERLPGMRHFAALIRYCRRKLGREHMPSGVANQTEEVIEDNQTEEDNEEAVMIVNTLLSGGDVETNDEQIKLADYGEVADAKGREGKTRPVSASQPASSAFEPGAAIGQYIDFNVTLDGDVHTRRETPGRLLSSESGAANGEYVGLSKVLEMNSHQKDEDGKKSPRTQKETAL